MFHDISSVINPDMGVPHQHIRQRLHFVPAINPRPWGSRRVEDEPFSMWGVIALPASSRVELKSFSRSVDSRDHRRALPANINQYRGKLTQ